MDNEKLNGLERKLNELEQHMTSLGVTEYQIWLGVKFVGVDKEYFRSLILSDGNGRHLEVFCENVGRDIREGQQSLFLCYPYLTGEVPEGIDIQGCDGGKHYISDKGLIALSSGGWRPSGYTCREDAPSGYSIEPEDDDWTWI